MGNFLQPTRLDEALDAVGRGRWVPLAGGTDFYPARVDRPIDENVLDLSRIDALRGIDARSDVIRIGALTTWTQIFDAPLPPAFDALKLAAREVGGIQIQNAGTIGGNLCNASPAADGVPPLLALDARVELSSARGSRIEPLESFLLGPRKTALAPDELLTAVLLPAPPAGSRSAFLKLGARRYLLISIAMVAVVIEIDDRGAIPVIRRAGIAVGACSPVAMRLRSLEAKLVGAECRRASSLVTAGDLAALQPIDDVRATASYRCDAALTLVQRALDACGGHSR